MPGVRLLQVKVKSSVIVLKTGQPARIWRKVIKQKHPGAVSMKPRTEGKSRHTINGITTNLRLQIKMRQVEASFPPPGALLENIFT